MGSLKPVHFSHIDEMVSHVSRVFIFTLAGVKFRHLCETGASAA
jgi:hypothetical protein